MKATSSIDRVIGAKVREKRIALGLNMVALADTIGLSEMQLARIESGSVRIGAKTMLDLCKHFHVRLDYFFDGWEIVPHEQYSPAKLDAVSNAHTLSGR